MLEDYFNEFATVSETVSTTLSEFERSSEPLTKERMAESNIETNLRELKHFLSIIKLGIRSNGPSQPVSPDIVAREKKCQGTLEVLQRRWLLVRRGGSASSNSQLNDSHRRALVALERTESSTRTLDTTLKLAIESEELGNSILTNLNSQRETIQRTQAGAKEISTNLDESSTVLTRMSHWWNQFI